jgi:G:T-mismatch repair DNA endonuclease (very short patch repair protein)
VVEKPYVLLKEYDRKLAAQRRWETRRANPKPYPESARARAREQAIARHAHGGSVSQFERDVASVYRTLGFTIETSVPVRRANGTYLHVFDIVVPVRCLVVECHGTYWHGARWIGTEATPSQSKNLRYEERKHETARQLGIDLRVLWEHHFRQDPVGACLSTVR